MSLHLAAKHLASKGRGPDTTLVHMAPREVAGLQALAKAHGGSLTTNPHTGLPEAGFLSSILPMVAGAALAATGVGAPMAAMLVGGGYGLASGSLGKGLAAGLGAFGGAGIGAGLLGAGEAMGASAAAGEAGAAGEAAANAAITPTATAAAPSAAATEGQAMLGSANQVTSAADPTRWGSELGASSAPELPGQMLPPTTTPMPGNPSYEQMRAAGFSDADIGQSARDYASNAKGTAADPFSQSTQNALKNPVSAGLGNTDAWATKDNAKNAMYGLMSAAALSGPRGIGGPQSSGPNPYRYRFSWERPSGPNTLSSSEAAQLRGVYTPYAEGGPVSEMSAQNNAMAMMANGGQGFAEGGDVAKGMSGASADAMRYLYGQSATSPNAQAAQARMAQLAAMSPVAAPTVDASVASGSGGTFGKFLHELGIGTPAAPSYTWNPATQTYTTVSAGPAVADAGPAYTPPVVEPQYAANGGIMALAHGGQPDLGGYSDGGRLLRGPGDGVSDSIPATIGDKRPARLADGEFVVPARIVSELGNGSTEAGARKLYSMMDRVQHARNKTVGKGKVAVNSKADKALPA